MVHNGIEYSMMQGYAEGFELMAKSEYRLDLGKIADVWMHGSVVRSWLLELAVGALKQDPKLEKLKGYVQDSGEGRWMIQDAIGDENHNDFIQTWNAGAGYHSTNNLIGGNLVINCYARGSFIF